MRVLVAQCQAPCNGAKVSTGEFGAKWTSSQYGLKTVPAVVTKDNHLAHVYSRDPTGGDPSNSFLIVDVFQEFKCSGFASQWFSWDSQWWFDAIASSQFLSLKVEHYDEGSSSWQEVDLPPWHHETTTPTYMNSEGQDLPNNNVNGASVPTQTSGPLKATWNGWTNTKDVPHATIRVIARTRSKARPGTADNAVANTVKIFMELKLQTKMSSTQPNFQPGG